MSLSSFRWWPRLKAAALTSVAVVLASCGGSTFEAFEPARIISFGDEYSYIGSGAQAGRKFSVNDLTDAGALDCDEYRLWNQAVADRFDYSFAQCNPLGRDTSKALLYAQPGARTADVTAQIDQHVAAGGFRDGDLVLILAGANDVKALAAQSAEQTSAALLAAAYDLGKAMGAQVNRMIGLGARVVVMTTPDVGLAPYGTAQEALVAGRKKLLTDLTADYNRGMRDTITNDGRFAAVVLGADLVRRIVEDDRGQYGSYIHDQGACQDGLSAIDCTSATLRPDITTGRLLLYVYADDQHLSPNMNKLWADLALERIRENPF